MTQVHNASNKEELDKLITQTTATAVHFWATWCEPCKHLDKIFTELAVENAGISFVRVEAEEAPSLSEAYGVSAVPYFVFIKDGAVVDTMEGANPPQLVAKIASLAGPKTSTSARPSGGPTPFPAQVPAAPPPSSTLPLKERLEAITTSKPIVLFMKGSPDAPRCGFSSKVVGVLNELGAPFGSFDILSDESVRQGMKDFSNWPTFPQLYVAGEFTGGCDIVLEMHGSGELKQLLEEKGVLGGGAAPASAPAPSAAASTNGGAGNGAANGGATAGGGNEVPDDDLTARLKKLLSSHQTMLFMKGTPSAPRCGFSSKVVAALREEGVDFQSFDILSDEEVRQGLKNYSDWPTYPQLYHNGELVGGCDIILEMHKGGELKSTLS